MLRKERELVERVRKFEAQKKQAERTTSDETERELVERERKFEEQKKEIQELKKLVERVRKLEAQKKQAGRTTSDETGGPPLRYDDNLGVTVYGTEYQLKYDPHGDRIDDPLTPQDERYSCKDLGDCYFDNNDDPIIYEK